MRVRVPDFLRGLSDTTAVGGDAIVANIINRDPAKGFCGGVVSLNMGNAGNCSCRSRPECDGRRLLPFNRFMPFRSLLHPLTPVFGLPVSSFDHKSCVRPGVRTDNARLTPTLYCRVICNRRIESGVARRASCVLALSGST